MSRWPGPQGIVGSVERILSDGVSSVTTDTLNNADIANATSGNVLQKAASGSDLEFAAGGGGGVGHLASDQDGSNGGAQIQNAIDAAAAADGVGLAVVDTLGPDAGSDVTNASGSYSFPSDIWLGTSALTIPDDVCLWIPVPAWLVLQDGADDNIIRNADTTNGNDNCAIVGHGDARLHGNADNQTLSESGNSLSRLGVRFYKVKDPYISGIRVGPTHGYAIQIENPTRGDSIQSVPRVENVYLEQDDTTDNQDGVHCVAPFDGVEIDGVRGTVADDGIVVNADDGGSHIIVGDGGDATGLVAENINLRSQAGTAALFATVPDEQDTHVIRDIHVGPGSWDDNGDGSRAIKFGAVNGHGMSANRGITIEGISATDKLVSFRGPVRDVVIERCVADNNLWGAGGTDSKNIRISDSMALGGEDFVARIGGNVTVDDLVFENCAFIREGTQANTAIELRGNNSDTHVGFRLINCYFENWSTGFTIESGAQLTDVREEKTRYEGCSTDRSINVESGYYFEGETKVSANSESPSSQGRPGLINFTDSGDGSGDGLYVEDRDGTVHGPV